MAIPETRLTVKGQVTIPAEIRALLGLKPGDRVRFEITGNEVVLKPAPSRIARHAGAVPAKHPPLSRREEREAFELGVAEDAERGLDR